MIICRKFTYINDIVQQELVCEDLLKLNVPAHRREFFSAKLLSYLSQLSQLSTHYEPTTNNIIYNHKINLVKRVVEIG